MHHIHLCHNTRAGQYDNVRIECITYVIYGMRGVVERAIQHESKPSAVSPSFINHVIDTLYAHYRDITLLNVLFQIPCEQADWWLLCVSNVAKCA